MEQEEKKYSILDELAKCSGYDIALLTTFNFEIGFFERAVLNRLFAKDVKTVSLFVDSKELTNALNQFDMSHSGSHLGRKYMVNPVKMDGSFHPKVILLLGEKKARLFVGSANVKTSGYATNNEVFNFIDYDANNTKYLDVIVAAIDFFDAINEISYKLDNGVIRAAKEYIYYHKAEKNAEVALLHNMKTPILDQAAAVIPGDVKNINIAVPYYDKELLALQQIKGRFPDAEINLYVQNMNSTFPVGYNEQNHIVENINTFCRFLDNSSSTSGNFYHGKVFLFKTADKSYVLYGSANCTLSALSKTYQSGGNVECDFLEVGAPSEFDYFFANMDLEVEEKLTSQEMVYETPTPTIFSFKYGEVKESIELHIGCAKEIDGLSAKLGDKELEYMASNGELIVFVGEDCRNVLTDIFELSLTYGDQTEIIRCWTYNPVILANSREVQNKRDNLSDFEIESTGDKYIEDRIKFFKAEATCLNEWQEYKNNLKYMNQIKMEQESESEGPEDFVIDYQIPDEYRYAYRQYSAASKIRNMFVRRFLGTSFIVDTDDTKGAVKTVTQSGNEISTPVCRKATSEEIKFERFIKGKVKGMMNDVYVEVIELEHYIGLVQVVMEIFEKYCDVENVEDIFLPDYVVQTKFLFMRKIIGKQLENLPDKDEMQDAIIKKSFQTILETYLFYRNLQESEERWQFESLNKALLGTLEKKYSLRQSYRPVIKRIIAEGKGGGLPLDLENACSYIEQLYGYKTYEMLCAAIGKVYPGAEIIPKGSSLKIVVETDRILDCNRLDTSVLSEIENYSRNVSKVTTVYFEFINTVPNLENKNIITRISHSVSMEYHQWKHGEIRFNGERRDSKSKYLQF